MPIAADQKTAEAAAQAAEYPLLDAVNAGTAAMRKAGEALLPKWPKEESDSYAARLKVATLFPAYRRTVSVMSGKPFAKALVLNEAPPAIKKWAEDIDSQGVNLHTFASEMFRESFYGLAGILVDYPDSRPRDEQGRPVEGPMPQETVAQREASGKRPYFVRVMHGQILGWRIEKVKDKLKLTQLRILESREEPDGEYDSKHVPVVRVLRPGSWETLEKIKDTWVRTDSGTTTLADIPFVPVYGLREAFMRGCAPLIDLAYLNVKHWQSQSDQDTITQVARVPILVATGVEDTKWSLTVGTSAAVSLPQDATLAYVEHTGAAIEAGAKALAALEEQMIQAGAELLVKKPGDRSATEASNDAEGNKCDLQRMAEGFEDALDQALAFMAQYAGLGESGSVSLFKDYGAVTLSDASATLVKDLQMAGVISKETLIKEMQRRDILSADIDPETELEAAEADGPSLGTMLPAEPLA